MGTTLASTQHSARSDLRADGRRSISLRSPDGEPQIKEFLGQPSESNHIVQFYDTDAFLCDNVAHFVGAGLAAGEPTLVIATAPHRNGFRERLERSAQDLDHARAVGLYIELDAHQVLAQFMVGSLPDPTRFREFIGGMVAAAQAVRPEGRVRAYREMVDLLWREGNKDGALALEELWNDLGKTQPFSLLCAYTMRNFESADDSLAFQALCHAHTHVIPSEGYSAAASSDGRLREISLLQQRAASLEHEVARRKELEIELRAALAQATIARAQAERTVRFNEMFAGMLGHDLRNPLHAILTTADYIARSGQDGRTTAAAIRIASSSQRMARMIEQLLDFTKIRVGDGLALQRTRVNLMDLCDGIKGELESANPGCAIVLSSRGDTIADLDCDRMLQVLSSLIGNAVYHGAPTHPVSVEAIGTCPEHLSVQVNNSGVVPVDVFPVLFEPFRAISKGQHTRGLGLGLYIARQIVAAHGGKISVTSNDTEGTTFCIELPRLGMPCSPN